MIIIDLYSWALLYLKQSIGLDVNYIQLINLLKEDMDRVMDY